MLLGRYGEALAAEYLRKKGCRILAMNYRTRLGELDVIAQDGRYLAFVEVKLRRSGAFAPARAFVTAEKQRRLRLTAEYYLLSHPTDLQPRFDVAEVYAPEGLATRAPEIHYYPNAF